MAGDAGFSGELVPQQAEEIVLPTGELVRLDDPERCARALLEFRERVDTIRSATSVLGEALADYSREQGSKTLHLGGVTASVSMPTSIIWDHEVLEELREEGLPEARFNELVVPEVTYKVNRSVANSIAKSNPVYGEIIERAQERHEKSPSVSVKPSKGG
jgi:hypothetical protein